MYNLDRREEFKDKLWQQGSLLPTLRTQKMSEELKKRYDYDEKCRAFVNFTMADEGRSRTLIFIYKSPEECLEAVIQHNKPIIEKQKREQEKLRDLQGEPHDN